MPTTKHRRKPGGKSVPHPGQGQGKATPDMVEETGKGSLPPQKGVAGLPLFAAAPPRVGAGKRLASGR